MNIVIVGQGAIGLLWYHQLAKDTNNRLSLVCSARIKSAPEKTTFTDIENNESHRPLAIAKLTDLLNAQLILICVKSYQVESVLVSIIKHIKPDASIIFCHNGMVDFNQFPPLTQACYTLLTTHASKIIKPFHAHHTGLGHNDLGLLSGNAKTTAQDKVLKKLTHALPSVTFSNNIREKQWLKLAINCVINPITAIDNIENGQLNSKKYSIIIKKLLIELITVINAESITLELDFLQAQVMQVVKNTAKNCSSMRSDILQQRKTEIDYINGYIVNLAKKRGIAVPENEKIIQQIKALEV